jgi:small multidrug resistance family-3 protein
MSPLMSVGLFVLAGPCEIGEEYLVWQYLRQGKPIGYGIIGAIILVL